MFLNGQLSSAYEALVTLSMKKQLPINYDSPDLDRSDVLSDRLDDGRRLVTEDAGEEPLGVVAVQGVDVGVAERVGDHLHTNLAWLRI